MLHCQQKVRDFIIARQLAAVFLIILSLGDVYGPFISLPTDQQKQVIEFLYYAGDIPEKLVNSITRCQQGNFSIPSGLCIVGWIIRVLEQPLTVFVCTGERLSSETMSYLDETLTL